MSNYCYGVLGRDGGFIETSTSERGAKRKASNDGCDVIYCMHRVSWAVWKVAKYDIAKKRWIPENIS